MGGKHASAATLVVFGLGVLTLQVIVYEGTAILTDNHSRRASARARGASAVTELSNVVQLRTLHQSGPASTTIDIVLLSEAYTAATPFFADASRATRHYFSSDEATFYGISPLLNVHALYLPSAVGRIGWGAPAGTTFGCYRAVNEPLRAIFQANFTLLHAQRACRHHLGCSGCDFLVLLVNEPLYGGFAADGVTMITNSLTSGAISARHELAHALADFGEEYDGGGDYSGDNFAATSRLCEPGEEPMRRGGRLVWQCVPWGAWLPRGGIPSGASGHARTGDSAEPWLAKPVEGPVEEVQLDQLVRRSSTSSALLYLSHPWHRLTTTNKPFSARFSIGSFPGGADGPPGGWVQLRISWSMSGVSSPSDVSLTLDGQAIRWQPEPHVDRQFHQHTFYRQDDSRALSQGQHELLFRVGRPDAGATLCHLMIHIFASGFGSHRAMGRSADRFHARRGDPPAGAPASGTGDDATGGLIGTFPVSSAAGHVIGYRPTQDSCLMREMRHTRLCPVCHEAIWRNLLTSTGARRARVSLIHWVQISQAQDFTAAMPMDALPMDASSSLLVEARVAPLGYFRAGKLIPGETMTVKVEALGTGAVSAAIEMLPSGGGAREGLGAVVARQIPFASERLDGEEDDRTGAARVGAAGRQAVGEQCWRIVVRAASPEIAVEGCCHGELDSIYSSIAVTEQRHGVKVDVLLICGDFQAVRNQADLATMACPAKYRSMQGFYRYYSGEKVAPVLTIFVGGNHEAASHLWELYYGGWVAPNIYFLGYAGVVNVGGVRIGGLSGIYNARHYDLGHYEIPPYNDSDMRSAYHVRRLEVFRLSQLRTRLDVFLSHDWPQHIARHGDTNALLRKKSFLRDEVASGSLGSPPNAMLLRELRPAYWFAAHLHVKFAALVVHNTPPPGGQPAPPSAAGGLEPCSTRPATVKANPATRFLSLDKCLPNRDFLQLFRIDGDGSPPVLKYDPEWIAVLRSTAHLFTISRSRLPLEPPSLVAALSGGRTDFTPQPAELQAVFDAVGGDLTVPLNFSVTAAPHYPGEPIAGQPCFRESPQTQAFVRTFSLPPDWRTQQSATAHEAEAQSMPLNAVQLPAVWGASGGIFAPMPVPMDEEIDLGDD